MVRKGDTGHMQSLDWMNNFSSFSQLSSQATISGSHFSDSFEIDVIWYQLDDDDKIAQIQGWTKPPCIQVWGWTTPPCASTDFGESFSDTVLINSSLLNRECWLLIT